MANIIPEEYDEQVAFVQWLNIKGYPCFHVPNSTYTKSFKQKIKNKKLGVSSGVPDLFVAVPFPPPHLIIAHKDRDDEVRNKTLVAIEMKRKKGGVTSENQKKWIKTLNEAGVQAVVCKGCDAAIEFIESITKRS